jgi:hypothetical protein
MMMTNNIFGNKTSVVLADYFLPSEVGRSKNEGD